MTRRRAPVADARGFSLLEAIVALTVFSICAVALYGWLATNMRALGRVEAHHARVRDGRAALAVLESLNPMEAPRGERRLPGDLEVRWTSRALTPPRPGKGSGGNTLVFDLALYNVDVEVRRAGTETNRFTVRRAGWKTARTMGDGF